MVLLSSFSEIIFYAIMKYHFKWPLVFFMLCVRSTFGTFDPNAVPHTTKTQVLQFLENGDQEFLVYFYTKFESCPDCKLYMPNFQEAAGYLDQLEDEKMKSYKLAVKFPEYGVVTFPQLLFFRGKIPFRYDMTGEFNPDDIVVWVENAKQTSFPHLTDETFEHLTQASTGSTTGDWLIMFANKQRPDCWEPNLPDLAATAVHLRGRKNIAVVDVSTNPITAKRFDLENTCFKLLFFHRTDLYHYNSDDTSSRALIKYVLESYSNDEASSVPPPHSEKSAQMENMVAGLKKLLEDHAYLSVIAFVSGIGFGCLSVFAVLIFIIQKYRKRKLL